MVSLLSQIIAKTHNKRKQLRYLLKLNDMLLIPLTGDNGLSALLDAEVNISNLPFGICVDQFDGEPAGDGFSRGDFLHVVAR